MMRKNRISALIFCIFTLPVWATESSLTLYADIGFECSEVLKSELGDYYVLKADQRTISYFNDGLKEIKTVTFPVSGDLSLENIDAILWQLPATLYVFDGLGGAVFELDRFLTILRRYSLPASNFQFRQALWLTNRNWLLFDPFAGVLVESMSGSNQVFEWGSFSLNQYISTETVIKKTEKYILVWTPRQKLLLVLNYQGSVLRKMSFPDEGNDAKFF
ncbi:MAG TPA: hypothetical protein ENN84_04685, partial [Candidatus Marinimicrobia bacterium]|nr:hypothetical protein [Candidatus Neomarinimicrobiota bacterium]